MNPSFTEHVAFAKVRDELFGRETSSDSFRGLQSALMNIPRGGEVIQGTSGARKVRWASPMRGKGKRGGIRVIYYYHEESDRILLLAVYDKNISDLTPEEKAEIARLIQAFREEAARKQRRP